MTLAQLENDFVEQLLPLYGIDEAKSLAWLTINHVSKIDRSQYLLQKQEVLSLEKQTSLYQILNELKIGKPLQYILGQTEFYGLPFIVNSSVLIPRPETEELVHWILKSLSDQSIISGKFCVLDIGTGSGCIPIALKKNLPNIHAFGVDVSPIALETALKNATLNEVEVEFIQDDILNACSEILNAKYDVIVSNPPYVRLSEKNLMHANVLDYEPHLALFVSDDKPLIFYEAIADFALAHLSEEGKLFFEINEGSFL